MAADEAVYGGSSFSRRALLALAAAVTTGKTASGVANAQPFREVRNPEIPERGEFLIRAGYVLTMDPALGELSPGEIHVRDGEIIAVGQRLQVTGVRIIEADDMIALPGFVDTHIHLWNGLLKGLIRSEDPRMSYFPLSQRAGPLFTPEDTFRAVQLGTAEALSSGITTLHDWSHNTRSGAYADAEISALLGMGIRARFSYGWGQDFPLTRMTDLDDVARVQREWLPRSNLLTLGVALRTPAPNRRGAVSIELTREEFEGARRLGLPLSMHSSPGVVSVLNGANLLGPDVQLVHPLGWTADERSAISRSNTKVSTSPTTELGGMQASDGYIQYAELSEAGVQLALSLDTSGTRGSSDFFSCMRALMWSHAQRSDTKLPLHPRRILELATIEGARQLGLEDKIGTLKAGKRADIILLRSTDPNLAPVFDPIRAVVVSGLPSNVDTVIVDGRILREGGKFSTLDSGQISREAADAARSIKERLAI